MDMSSNANLNISAYPDTNADMKRTRGKIKICKHYTSLAEILGGKMRGNRLGG
jgi:hypothetical protein